jgi:hypothetical protein
MRHTHFAANRSDIHHGAARPLLDVRQSRESGVNRTREHHVHDSFEILTRGINDQNIDASLIGYSGRDHLLDLFAVTDIAWDTYGMRVRCSKIACGSIEFVLLSGSQSQQRALPDELARKGPIPARAILL